MTSPDLERRLRELHDADATWAEMTAMDILRAAAAIGRESGLEEAAECCDPMVDPYGEVAARILARSGKP